MYEYNQPSLSVAERRDQGRQGNKDWWFLPIEELKVQFAEKYPDLQPSFRTFSDEEIKNLIMEIYMEENSQKNRQNVVEIRQTSPISALNAIHEENPSHHQVEPINLDEESIMQPNLPLQQKQERGILPEEKRQIAAEISVAWAQLGEKVTEMEEEKADSANKDDKTIESKTPNPPDSEELRAKLLKHLPQYSNFLERLTSQQLSNLYEQSWKESQLDNNKTLYSQIAAHKNNNSLTKLYEINQRLNSTLILVHDNFDEQQPCIKASKSRQCNLDITRQCPKAFKKVFHYLAGK